jgi:hypothetical protein
MAKADTDGRAMEELMSGSDHRESDFGLGPPFSSSQQTLHADMRAQIRSLHYRLQNLEQEARSGLFGDNNERIQEELDVIRDVMGDELHRDHQSTKGDFKGRPQQDVGSFFRHRELENRLAHDFNGQKLPNERLERKDAKPQLNYVTWEAFQACLEQEESSAIDVLVGEPKSIAELDSFWRGGSLGIKETNAPITMSGVGCRIEGMASITGREPLPERIRINSKPIIRILSKIHQSNISPRGEPVIFFRPFKVLVFYQKEIREWVARLEKKSSQEIKTAELSANDLDVREEKDEGTIGSDNDLENGSDARPEWPDNIYKDLYLNGPGPLYDMKCLIDFIDRHLEAKSSYLHGSNHLRVLFSDIWHLFKPGDSVVTQDKQQAYRVIGVKSPSQTVKTPAWRSVRAGEDSSFVIDCVYIDFDGQRLGPVSQKFVIPRFDGEREVTSLDVFPIRFAKDEDAEVLIRRGYNFVQVTGIAPMHYAGPTLDSGVEVDGTVVIDFEKAFIAEGAEWKPTLERLVITEKAKENKYEDMPGRYMNEVIHDDAYVDTTLGNEFILQQLTSGESHREIPSLTVCSSQTPKDIIDITRSEFLIMNYRVFGFILASKKWGEFFSSSRWAVAKVRVKRSWISLISHL